MATCRVLLALLVGSVLALARNAAGETTIPIDQAEAAFALARAMSREDAGKTWGTEVCGPMLFADAQTQLAVANQADSAGVLRHDGDVWTGKLPVSVHVANTAMDWAGVHWTMVAWPPPAGLRDRMQLLAHECFHRIQSAIKLPANDAVNAHLDSDNGRVWMLLEWRALERALVETGGARRLAIADALRFRQYRRSLFPRARENEDHLEMNEGLAEYTGVRLANGDEASRRAAAVAALRSGPGRASFVRSFAYASGPAYGVLLDESDTSWRRRLTPDSDLGALLGKAMRIPETGPDSSAATAAASRYGGEQIVADESARAVRLRAERERLRQRFIDRPVLTLPVLDQFSFGFDPNGLTALTDEVVVYRSLRVSDQWGVLEAEPGSLMRENGRIVRVVVPAPAETTGRSVTGDGWKLSLKPGFVLKPGGRKGDWAVARE